MKKGVFVFRLSNELPSIAYSELRSVLVADVPIARILDKFDEFVFVDIATKDVAKVYERTSLVIEVGELIDVIDEGAVFDFIKSLKSESDYKDLCVQLDAIRGFGKKELIEALTVFLQDFGISFNKKCQNIVKIASVNGIIIAYRVLYRRRKIKFDAREPHKRPCYRPGTMKPCLARALVNLAQIPSDGTQIMLDPFCGVGGIVLEACNMNIKALCSDLDSNMVLCAKKNIEFFNCTNNIEVLLADATKTFLKSLSVDAIVTDPPYGRQSIPRGSSLKKLIEGFISNAIDILRSRRRMVFAVPIEFEDYVDALLTDYGFSVAEKHLNMVHGSLTRVIYVAVKT
jgi:tRNA (guanine10-N2)-dimethyltransferase